MVEWWGGMPTIRWAKIIEGNSAEIKKGFGLEIGIKDLPGLGQGTHWWWVTQYWCYRAAAGGTGHHWALAFCLLPAFHARSESSTGEGQLFSTLSYLTYSRTTAETSWLSFQGVPCFLSKDFCVCIINTECRRPRLTKKLFLVCFSALFVSCLFPLVILGVLAAAPAPLISSPPPLARRCSTPRLWCDHHHTPLQQPLLSSARAPK